LFDFQLKIVANSKYSIPLPRKFITQFCSFWSMNIFTCKLNKMTISDQLYIFYTYNNYHSRKSIRILFVENFVSMRQGSVRTLSYHTVVRNSLNDYKTFNQIYFIHQWHCSRTVFVVWNENKSIWPPT
jgi:hypothetical protein